MKLESSYYEAMDEFRLRDIKSKCHYYNADELNSLELLAYATYEYALSF